MPAKTLLRVGHLKITDHLVLGITLNKIQKGEEVFQHLDLQAQVFGGWNPLAMALREDKIDAACILAPLAMELFHIDGKAPARGSFFPGPPISPSAGSGWGCGRE